MGSSQSLMWQKTFEEMKTKHDAAYQVVEEAISLEEDGRPRDAIARYNIALALIDDALKVQVQCPDNPDHTWEEAAEMVQKIKRTRAKVLERINSILQAYNELLPREPSPSCDEAEGNDRTLTNSDLATALENIDGDSRPGAPIKSIYSLDGVQVYFISHDGTVSSMREQQQLNIYIADDEESKTSAFLQVGDWVYPLVPGVSPCFRTDFGGYIFPNVHSEDPSASVGIILPKDADASVYDALESILHGIVGQAPTATETSEESPEGITGTISSGIASGANMISRGLIGGAEKASELIKNSSAPKIVGGIEPGNNPKPIPNVVRKTVLLIAEKAIPSSVSSKGHLVARIGGATVRLGRYLAPHIQKQGTNLLHKGFLLSEEDAAKNVDGVLNVAAGAAEGISTVYSSLQTSASILGQSLSSNTVNVAEQKFGDPAGEVIGDALGTAGNVVENVSHPEPQEIVENAAEATTGAAIPDAVEENALIANGNASTSAASGNTETQTSTQLQNFSDAKELVKKDEDLGE